MKPSKILVVVADRDLADSLGELLDARGFAAEIADDAPSALLAMTAFEPDVALFDIRLGRTGGLDLIGDLKRHRRDLVCIVITADAKADSVIEALRAGADDILRKPFDPAASSPRSSAPPRNSAWCATNWRPRMLSERVSNAIARFISATR